MKLNIRLLALLVSFSSLLIGMESKNRSKKLSSNDSNWKILHVSNIDEGSMTTQRTIIPYILYERKESFFWPPEKTPAYEKSNKCYKENSTYCVSPFATTVILGTALYGLCSYLKR